jgi:hypothetical protein
LKKNIDPNIRQLAETFIANGKNRRAIAFLRILLERGSISTDELNDLGYNHPPRAAGDVRDAGIPIITEKSLSKKTGRQMGVYTFGDPGQIQAGRIGGRSALPKKFKTKLMEKYGSIDCITGAKLDERVLQIDHRVPYRVAGDLGLYEQNVADYMLLDASSQRAKSWSCEKCANIERRDVDVCRSCYWASPEEYTHIALQNIRRTDIVWQEADVEVYDAIKVATDKRGISVREALLELARHKVKDS